MAQLSPYLCGIGTYLIMHLMSVPFVACRIFLSFPSIPPYSDPRQWFEEDLTVALVMAFSMLLLLGAYALFGQVGHDVLSSSSDYESCVYQDDDDDA